jgi:hypothetical protein
MSYVVREPRLSLDKTLVDSKTLKQILALYIILLSGV